MTGCRFGRRQNDSRKAARWRDYGKAATSLWESGVGVGKRLGSESMGKRAGLLPIKADNERLTEWDFGEVGVV